MAATDVSILFGLVDPFLASLKDAGRLARYYGAWRAICQERLGHDLPPGNCAQLSESLSRLGLAPRLDPTWMLVPCSFGPLPISGPFGVRVFLAWNYVTSAYSGGGSVATAGKQLAFGHFARMS